MKNLDKYCNSEDRLACRTNLTCSAVLSSGAQHQQDVELLEQGPEQATRMITVL